MSSYVIDNLAFIGKRHYVRTATADNCWFDFTYNKVQKYRQDFADDFCLVVNGSKTVDKAYIIPFKTIKQILTKDNLDPDQRGWSGTVRNNILRLCGRSVSVLLYYNAFHLLMSNQEEGSTGIVEGTLDNFTLNNSRIQIKEFNNRYKNVEPQKHIIVSEQIVRPGAITDFLKKLRNHTCQVCQEEGFLQTNGTKYIEAHHIMELHKLIPSSYCSDNIIVVCANCHRKLHFADVKYQPIDGTQVMVSINGNNFEFRRNIIT